MLPSNVRENKCYVIMLLSNVRENKCYVVMLPSNVGENKYYVIMIPSNVRENRFDAKISVVLPENSVSETEKYGKYCLYAGFFKYNF